MLTMSVPDHSRVAATAEVAKRRPAARAQSSLRMVDPFG
jgi:hypothetical protein